VRSADIKSKGEVKAQLHAQVFSDYCKMPSKERNAFLSATTADFKEHLFDLAQTQATISFRSCISKYAHTEVEKFYLALVKALLSPKVQRAPIRQTVKNEFRKEMDFCRSLDSTYSLLMSFEDMIVVFWKALEDTKELRESLGNKTLEIKIGIDVVS